MPYTRLQELGALAEGIQKAFDRNDDIGMDMLRDTLPEVRETIDAVNAALREKDRQTRREFANPAQAPATPPPAAGAKIAA